MNYRGTEFIYAAKLGNDVAKLCIHVREGVLSLLFYWLLLGKTNVCYEF
jgi:hypothetical protein